MHTIDLVGSSIELRARVASASSAGALVATAVSGVCPDNYVLFASTLQVSHSRVQRRPERSPSHNHTSGLHSLMLSDKFGVLSTAQEKWLAGLEFRVAHVVERDSSRCYRAVVLSLPVAALSANACHSPPKDLTRGTARLVADAKGILHLFSTEGT